MQVSSSDAKFAAQDANFDASILKTQETAKKAELETTESAQAASPGRLREEEEGEAGIAKQVKNLKLVSTQKPEALKKAEQVKESVLVRKEDADELAGNFSGKQGNREYRLELGQLSQLAQDLGTEITPEKSTQEIIEHVKNRLRSQDQTGKVKEPDVSQINKGFEFLIYVTEQQKGKTAPGSPENTRFTEIGNHVKLAKDEHYQKNAKAIDTASKIIGIAGDVSEEMGATVKETLDTMRDIINNPQDAQTKRKYYEQHGGYSAMIEDAKKLFHFIGEKLKQVNVNIGGEKTTKPVLDNAEMNIMNTETKVLQAVTRVPILSKSQERIIFKRLVKAGVIS